MAVVKLNKDNIDEKIKADISKPTAPKMQQITTAKTDKKSNLIAEIFQPIISRSISDMAMTALSTVSDIVMGAIDMKLYGENRHKNIRSLINTNRNYNSLYRSTNILGQPTVINSLGTNQNMSSLYHNPTSGFRLKDVIVPTKGDAELVVDALCEKIDMFGVATVGDYYDAVGIATTAIDFKYGWVNLSSATNHRTGDGYIIILPTPKPLD